MASNASPIKTVVIIVKENHTFDNYFGSFSGADGDPTLSQAPNPPTTDPNHTHQAWLRRKAGATRLGYKESDIPAYFAYARQFTLCDNYFTAVAGPSTPNHLMLVTADSPLIDNPPTYRGRPEQTYDLPSLPDQLDAAGLTWGSYTTGYPFNLVTKLGTRNMKPQSAFAGDAAAGRLPNVSWIYGPSIRRCSRRGPTERSSIPAAVSRDKPVRTARLRLACATHARKSREVLRSDVWTAGAQSPGHRFRRYGRLFRFHKTAQSYAASVELADEADRAIKEVLRSEESSAPYA